MIDKNDFDLGKWKLVESSEQGMLSQVLRANKSKQWIVFLGWAPHPMNKKIKLKYLAGGDSYFGPNKGASKVYTVQRKDFTKGGLVEGPKVRNTKEDPAEAINPRTGLTYEGKTPVEQQMDDLLEERTGCT